MAPAAAPPALSPPKGVYPSWTIDPDNPAAKDHSGTITFGVKNFPDATYTVVKTIDDGRSVQLRTNETDWIPADTPFGQIFGASGPSATTFLLSTRVNSANANQAVLTITFAQPVASGTLGIAVSDIDLDSLQIAASDANLNPLTGAQLNGNVFNLCDSAAPPTGCGVVLTGGAAALNGFDVPTWDPTTQTCIGNGQSETEGAACWWRPTAALKEIVMVFTPVPSSASPSFRLWFATLKSNVSGVVEFDGTPPVPGDYQLIAPDGSIVQEGVLGPNGEFEVTDVSSQNGYRIRITLATGETREVTVGLASGDVFTDLVFTGETPAPMPEPHVPTHPTDTSDSGEVTLASFGTLPETGSEAGLPVFLGLALCVAGMALLAATRRRRLACSPE